MRPRRSAPSSSPQCCDRQSVTVSNASVPDAGEPAARHRTRRAGLASMNPRGPGLGRRSGHRRSTPCHRTRGTRAPPSRGGPAGSRQAAGGRAGPAASPGRTRRSDGTSSGRPAAVTASVHTGGRGRNDCPLAGIQTPPTPNNAYVNAPGDPVRLRRTTLTTGLG